MFSIYSKQFYMTNLRIQYLKNKRDKFAEKFKVKSTIKHNNKYDYSKSLYVRNDIKLIIICPVHGEFLQTPSNHLRGQGCDMCLNESLKSDWDTVKENFYKIHQNVFDYSDSKYINTNTPIIIKCKKHNHTFSQRPSKHLKGQGCPKCKQSHGERLIEQFLIKNNILYECQKTFKDCKTPDTKTRLRYDFYLPEYNLLIEYNGEQHYRPRPYGNQSIRVTNESFERVKWLDKLKKKFTKKYNFNFLIISYKEIKIIESILSLQINLNK